MYHFIPVPVTTNCVMFEAPQNDCDATPVGAAVTCTAIVCTGEVNVVQGAGLL